MPIATCTIPYPTSKIVPEYTVSAPVEFVLFEASTKPCVPLLMTLIPETAGGCKAARYLERKEHK
jgi:hypothetical protein